MQSDRCETRPLGTNLVEPPGTDPRGVELPEEIRRRIECR
jgi:hypothetical protein